MANKPFNPINMSSPAKRAQNPLTSTWLQRHRIDFLRCTTPEVQQIFNSHYPQRGENSGNLIARPLNLNLEDWIEMNRRNRNNFQWEWKAELPELIGSKSDQEDNLEEQEDNVEDQQEYYGSNKISHNDLILMLCHLDELTLAIKDVKKRLSKVARTCPSMPDVDPIFVISQLPEPMTRGEFQELDDTIWKLRMMLSYGTALRPL
jgi:hypothetical protein